MDYNTILVSVGASVLYSLLWYSRQVVDPTKPTPAYDFWKLGATIVVGAVVGIIAIISGVEVTQVGIESQLLAYGFVIAVIEQVGKAFYRNFEAKIAEKSS